ncbi:substrate-binding domain-containing protein [Glycomyces sp. L485]|nr:substrate-binding domain-containing protein [Glycomyces sp. L485]
MEEAARAAGYSVSISVLDPDEPYSDADVMARLPHAGSPAIVIAHDDTTGRAMRALRQAQPNAIVATGGEHLSEEPDDKDWRITLDDRGAAARATRHLLDLGHKTVHHLAIPSKAGRRLGWSDALAEAGREIPAPVECGWGIGSAYEAARELLDDPAVTAILCGNDDLAFGALRAAHLAGRAIPGDLSIIGFDDRPFAAYLTPALTTVDLDFRGVGRGAFELLRRRLERRGNRPRPAWRAPELIVRETSGPPDPRTSKGA